MSQATDEPSIERKPSFAQPFIRTTHYERDEFGVVSPSDLRRPRDISHVKVVSKYEKEKQKTADTSEIAKPRDKTSMVRNGVPKIEVRQQATGQAQSPDAKATPVSANTVANEAFKRESSFIDAFFADELRTNDRDLGNSKSWRQTALQRRAIPNVGLESFQVMPKTATAENLISAPVREAFVIPSSQALVDNYPYPKPSAVTNNTATESKPQPPIERVMRSVPESTKILQEDGRTEATLISGPSTSAKLGSLPEDDIDFLSAEEIRAAMGRRKSGIKSIEEGLQDRQKLEMGYATATPKALDEVVEGHVLNNHHVRRMMQQFERVQAVPKETKPNSIEAELQSSHSQSEPTPIESSIDRMRRWIEDGGTSLAKHFWQDPIEAGAPSEADLQFAKQMAGLSKSRQAREHVSGDLEEDLPMCKGLLERLKNDESRVEHAVYLLRTARRAVHGAEISKSLRTIRERRLRNTYERTEKQFEAASQALRDLDAEVVQKATNAFKRRLGIASRVLHKNHTLTRMLTWSAQARLDEKDIERSKAELYSEILTRLATLRDTQLALARLMDHAIQTYGVSLKPADEALSRSAPNSQSEAVEATAKEVAAASERAGARFLADTAAAARLTDEIESQKAAMKGMSDDGYARVPKQTPRRTFEDKSPLAHSLFRPFNLQFENLGQKTEGAEAEEKLKEAFKQKIGDRKLVQEVRRAYEETYGSITAEHRQVPQSEGLESTETEEMKVFETLKEDPVGQAAKAVHGDNLVDSASPGKLASVRLEAKDGEAGLVDKAPPVASEGGVLASSSPPTVATKEAVKETSQHTHSFTHEAMSASNTATNEDSTHDASIINQPTHYTILVHDPQTDSLSITTSTSGPPRDTSPALPVHQALSALKAPAKFIPHISPGLEIVTAKRHILVLRDALDETSSTRGFETISAQTSAGTASEFHSGEVNPIDGTTRLSPTGYSGVEQDREQIERDFEERRQAAAAAEAARSKRSKHQARDEELPKRKRGGVGGVVKTAIWASAVCYIVGVTAEVLR